jgi:preprotein translocase subunit Sec61beta
MAKDNQISMPGVFGGLMRYNEEYTSKFMLTPYHVLGFIVLIIAFVIVLNIAF